MRDFEKRHAPRAIHTQGADTAVVCIHGILGSPCHFDFLEEAALGAGCAFITLLLPGHGGSGRAFAASGARAWKAYVLETLDALKKRYKRLLLVGHSMGGLLSLYAARTAPEGIDGLFLLALPLCAKLSMESVKTIFAVVFGRKDTPRRQVAVRSQGVMAPSLPGYLLWLPNFVKLLLFSYETRKHLGGIEQDVCILFSVNDESVSARSAKAAQKGLLRVSITMLRESSHYCYSPADMAEILRQFTLMALRSKK